MHLKLSILFFTIIFYGCQPILRGVYGVKKEKEESKVEQIVFLTKNKLSTEHLYNLRDVWLDSLKIGAKSLDTIKTDFCVPQFRVYDIEGKIKGAWGVCYGSLAKDSVFYRIPPTSSFLYYEGNKKLTLIEDAKMLEDFEGNRLDLTEFKEKYDYIFFAFWAEYLGVFSLDMLKGIEDWQKNHSELRVLVIKVNIGDS
jgi:hypothetical protein